MGLHQFGDAVCIATALPLDFDPTVLVDVRKLDVRRRLVPCQIRTDFCVPWID